MLVAVAVCATTTPLYRLASQNPGQGRGGDEPAYVDMKAGKMRSVKVGDSSVVTFVGNPIFHHNGAVITCDSAVRHTDRIFEWFGNVIINKDSTFIYGDRVFYNGNTAEVFSPLVKMMDGTTVLYTYNFIYDTETNIGEYYGGGTVARDETLLESDRGYYYGDTKDFICVGKAQLRDTAYMIKSDSLGYNTDTDIATFFSKSYIWNEKGEILSAEEGVYFTAEERYNFWSDAYIMTQTREMWAEDIDYRGGDVEDAIMRRDVQIRDDERKVLAFGDYAIYFGKRGEAMLTERPSLIGFDAAQGDSIFVRMDSLFLFVVDSMSPFNPRRGTGQQGGTASAGERPAGERPAGERPADGTPPAFGRGDLEAGATGSQDGRVTAITPGRAVQETETAAETAAEAGTETTVEAEAGMVAEAGAETVAVVRQDTLAGSGGAVRDSLLNEPLTVPDGGVAVADTLAGAVNDETVSATPDTAKETPQKTEKVKKEKKAKEPKPSRAERRAQRRAAREAARHAGHDHDHDGHDHGGVAAPGGGRRTQSRPAGPTPGLKDAVTEAFNAFRDNLLQMESGEGAAPVATAGQEEEVNRVVVAYNNVKIYRSDLQAVCDSLVAFSIDSTIHMYIDPVMWNGDNQIKSDEATIFTLNEQLDRALFVGGNPVMSAKLDEAHFNQITGKTIEAFFRDNELYRVDAVGNGITYYFMQDDKTQALQGFLVAESADITFFIAERTVETITFRGNPEYSIYPMDQIPATQEQRLPQFKWEAHRRPTQADVFDRIIKPSRREAYEAMPHPDFPLTLKINDHREKLVKGGTWRDRTDDISQEARDFVAAIQAQEARGGRANQAR